MQPIAERSQVMELVQSLSDEQVRYVLGVIRSLPREKAAMEKTYTAEDAEDAFGLWKDRLTAKTWRNIRGGCAGGGALLFDTDVLIWFLRGNTKARDKVLAEAAFLQGCEPCKARVFSVSLSSFQHFYARKTTQRRFFIV